MVVPGPSSVGAGSGLDFAIEGILRPGAGLLGAWASDVGTLEGARTDGITGAFARPWPMTGGFGTLGAAVIGLGAAGAVFGGILVPHAKQNL
jgi:hypothetical protein